MGGRGASRAAGAARVMSEDEYLARKGVGSPMSDYMLDKTKAPGVKTARQREAMEREAAVAAREHSDRRAAAREEYRRMVESGQVRPPTSVEKALKTARGNPDNESVRAARRALKKRGYDWKTGRRI